MFEKSNFLISYNIKSLLKKYKLALIYSFMSGLVIGSMHFINKSNENFKLQKLIQGNKILNMRVGIHLGDILFKDRDVFEYRVNIAI